MFGAICIQQIWLSEDDTRLQIQPESYECIPHQGKACSSKLGTIGVHPKLSTFSFTNTTLTPYLLPSYNQTSTFIIKAIFTHGIQLNALIFLIFN